MLHETTTDQIENAPTLDIAAWLAKNTVLQYAQKSAPFFFNEEAGTSTQIHWDIAKQEADGIQVADEVYETAIAAAVKGELSVDLLERAAEADMKHNDADTEWNVRAQQVGRRALQEGYSRLGAVKRTEDGLRFEARPSAVAAACFLRANIHLAVDRRLYDREPELLIAKTALLKAVEYRKLQLTIWEDYPDQYYSVYGLTYTYSHKLEHLAELLSIDVSGQTGRGLWWRELVLDFAKIDAEVVKIKHEEASSYR